MCVLRAVSQSSQASPPREMNALACLLLTAMCAAVSAAPTATTSTASTATTTLAPSDAVDNNATSTSHAEGADGDDADTLLLDPEPVPDGKPHHLEMGQCENGDRLLHAETLVVNNDGTSRVVGDIRVNVEAPVNITCFKVVDQIGESSGAFPSFKEGGLGHNYVVLGFNAAYGYGFNFLVELYGHDLRPKSDSENLIKYDLLKNSKLK